MQDELRESHFEAVVIGTGLTQSIVAAALAAANKPIIHIDESEAYGGPHASLSLSELASFNPTFDPSLVSRQYSLSLTPHLIPATGPFIAALVNSGVSRYGSFVLPKRVVIQTQDGFKNVPANKQDVFKDKAISLVQKRRLIKFLMFATGEFEQSTELQGKETTPLLEFVRDVFGIDKELAEALAYAVAFCVDVKDQTLPALFRTRAYLRSVGRYGPSPFLIGHYGGAGELAQGFCRTCAVQGGTYVLGRKVVEVTRHDCPTSYAEKGKEVEKDDKQEDGKETTHRSWTGSSGKSFTSYHPPSTFEGYGVEGVEVPSTDTETEAGSQTQAGQPEPEKSGTKVEVDAPTPTGPYFRVQLEGFAAPFTANMVIGSEGWLTNTLGEPKPETSNEPKLGNTIRAILIIDAPATFASPSEQPASSEGSSGETRLEESIIILPSEEGAVSVLVNGASTMSCPDGKCILYFTAQSSQDPKEYFTKHISAVLDACSPRPEIRGEVYWREQEIDKVVVRHADPSRQSPPRQEEQFSYSTTHLTEGSDAAAREAERVFWAALGDQPGQDGKGKDGVEFFARIEREEDLFDD